MAFPADHIGDTRAAIIEAIGADLCAKFAFSDLLTDARIGKWFVRLERAQYADPHRRNAPAANLVVTAQWICELFAHQSPADAVSSASDSYYDLLGRAESAVYLLCAAQADLGLGPVTSEVIRLENGYRAVLRFQTIQDIENG